MPSTINSTTTAGVAISGDNSGVLALQTNNGTTAVTIDTSQNVGIGTSSPGYALDVRSTAAPAIRLSRSGTAGQIASMVFEDGNATLGSGSTTRIASDAGAMSFSTGGTSGAVTGGTERMRIPAAGGLQVVNSISVGNATPTTSGAGITFPATQSASTDANTLDDYEEGTWTPTVGGNATYSSRSGQYVKIGRIVTVFGQMTINSIGTGSAQAIGGLPFTSPYECTIPVDKSQTLSLAITWIALRVSGTELYAVVRTAASTSGNVNPNYMTNSTEMQFCGTYII